MIANNPIHKYDVFISRTSGHLPVVQFKLTEGSPCINEEEYDFTPNRYFHKLAKDNSNKGCKTQLHEEVLFDDRYRLISGQNEVSMFSSAGIYKAMGNSSKIFKNNYAMDYQWNLYMRSYISWDSECEDKGLTRQAIHDQIKDVYTVNFWQSIFNFVSLVRVLLIYLLFGAINWSFSLYHMMFNKVGYTQLIKID